MAYDVAVCATVVCVPFENRFVALCENEAYDTGVRATTVVGVPNEHGFLELFENKACDTECVLQPWLVYPTKIRSWRSLK